MSKEITKLIIVTASHVTADIRLHTLYECISSIQRFQGKDIIIEHYISMHIVSPIESYFKKEKEWINTLKLLERDSYKIILDIIPEKYSQFDHFNRIFLTYSFCPTDLVMFIDDDDMLLIWPDINKIIIGECVGISGNHYLPYVNENISDNEKYDLAFGSLSDIQILMKKEHITNIWDTACDFSGYIGRYSDIDTYFSKRNKLINRNEIIQPSYKQLLANLEDTKFMTYCDNLGYVCLDDIFIYHRFLPGKKEWKNF